MVDMLAGVILGRGRVHRALKFSKGSTELYRSLWDVIGLNGFGVAKKRCYRI